MFTGIVEEIGKVKSIENREKSSSFTISASYVLEDSIVGDSIATNGVCLTLTKINLNSFQVDIMAETLRKSNLGDLTVGSHVNLERSLTLNKRLGGHLVSGHTDGIGEIISKEKEDNAIWLTIKTVPQILRYIIQQGSIAIDGVSLTIAYINESIFKVSVIPHTGKKTTLIHKNPGDTVNLECDPIGKYVEKLLNIETQNNRNSGKISEVFLKENGFF